MKINEPKVISYGEYASNKTIVNFTIDGQCSGCGGCCSNRLPLTDQEVNRLWRIIHQRNLKPIHHRPPGASLMVSVPVDMICPFRDPEKGCIIYDQRPWICREFSCDSDDSIVSDKIKQRIISGSKDFKTIKVRLVRQEIFD